MGEQKKKGAVKGKPKTALGVVEYRVNILFKGILSGVVLDTFKLREISVTHDWGVSDRQLTNYRKMALKKYAELADVNAKEEIGKAIARYQYLYNQCITKGHFKVALATQKEICTLLGLNTPTRHEVEMNPFLDLMKTAAVIEE